MEPTSLSGHEIRKAFIDYFVERGHTFVRSASVVPGNDKTLLFTNAGMVQFKDVFLGMDVRPYNRAVNSQKCIRVAGKHNDLDEVGRDNTHQTMFEMLGNWSFGDYYKKEAVAYAWDLLTNVFKLDKERIWFTVFKDEKGEIETDEEAADAWRAQPGVVADHVIYSGRKDNFWEMAETGPCGPCSEIHYDLGIDHCDKQHEPGHVCRVNGDCRRIIEFWNLVFIQYNRISATELIPLPQKHVDTGMGLERLTSLLQGVYSNFKTDLLLPLIQETQKLNGATDEERERDLTPYRVIADHARAAAFMIADGVIPGNTGRNYVCRMIIRRAALFGRKISLTEPFLAKIAQVVIDDYQHAFPELLKHEKAIIDNITREEVRFARTVDHGLSVLEQEIEGVKRSGSNLLEGSLAFDLYATHGLPLEITRDIVREHDIDVDVDGFKKAMEAHHIASGAGKAMGIMGGEAVDFYRELAEDLIATGQLPASGVFYDPYSTSQLTGPLLALVVDGERVEQASVGDDVYVVLPATNMYIESGGQQTDHGTLTGGTEQASWEIRLDSAEKPAAGLIVHHGKVISGTPALGDQAQLRTDLQRRNRIRRNHTATHILHAELRKVLGAEVHQSGSLVSPERLRFDFNYPQALTQQQLAEIEAGVNKAIYTAYPLRIVVKSLDEAINEGATALFGEKYGESVRTISFGDEVLSSYELCGGTHVSNTSEIGLFVIASESSIAAGVRRIEAWTGDMAYQQLKERANILQKVSSLVQAVYPELPEKIASLTEENLQLMREVASQRQKELMETFQRQLVEVDLVNDVKLLKVRIDNADIDQMRLMGDQFKKMYGSGVAVLGSVKDGNPSLLVVVTDDLVSKGINAVEMIRHIAREISGGGGGKPSMAQAGGKNVAGIDNALDKAKQYLLEHTK